MLLQAEKKPHSPQKQLPGLHWESKQPARSAEAISVGLSVCHGWFEQVPQYNTVTSRQVKHSLRQELVSIPPYGADTINILKGMH